MRPIDTDRVAWSVGLSVCHSSEPCINDRDAVWDLDSVGPCNHVLSGGSHWRNLANTIEPPMCGADAACCQLILTTLTTATNNKWSK